MDNSFVQIYRKIVDWEWYTNANTFKLFFHCLVKANYEDKTWQGIIIKRGQFLTGRKKLSVETGLTEMEIRTALRNLKTTNELTVKTTNKYSIITINNYEYYQSKKAFYNQQITNKQPTNNQQITTTNKIKKENKENKEKNIYTHTLENFSNKNSSHFGYGEYGNVYLTEMQRNEIDTFVMDKKAAEELIDELSLKIASNKEPVFNTEFPNMHIARLKAFWNYKKKNKKHSNKENKKTSEELLQEVLKEYEENE